MWHERVSTYGRTQMHGEELLGRPTVAEGRPRVNSEQIFYRLQEVLQALYHSHKVCEFAFISMTVYMQHKQPVVLFLQIHTTVLPHLLLWDLLLSVKIFCYLHNNHIILCPVSLISLHHL